MRKTLCQSVRAAARGQYNANVQKEDPPPLPSIRVVVVGEGGIPDYRFFLPSRCSAGARGAVSFYFFFRSFVRDAFASPRLAPRTAVVVRASFHRFLSIFFTVFYTLLRLHLFVLFLSCLPRSLDRVCAPFVRFSVFFFSYVYGVGLLPSPSLPLSSGLSYLPRNFGPCGKYC